MVKENSKYNKWEKEVRDFVDEAYWQGTAEGSERSYGVNEDYPNGIITLIQSILTKQRDEIKERILISEIAPEKIDWLLNGNDVEKEL